MKFSHRISLFIIAFLLQINLTAQVNPVSGIRNEKGLSQNTVHDIIQDKKGFLWFATEDGLNRYDGYNFTIFKNNNENKLSIPDNFIWTIFEDENGTLWIGTNSGGLAEFDYEKEKFVTYKNISNDINSLTLNNVRAVCEDRKGNIWVGTENGLDKFDRSKKTFTHYKNNPDDPNSLSNNVILSIFEDKNDNLWFGSNGGLNKYNVNQNNFTVYSFNDQGENSFNIVLSLYQDKEENIWVGTLKGLINFNIKTGKFNRFLVNTSDANSINSNRINTIIEPSSENKSGVLWIGTGYGLFRFDKAAQKFTKVETYISGYDLNNKNILSLFEDRSGLIWIGTAEDGVLKYDRERLKFKHYRHDPFDPNSLSHNTIRAIYEYKDILWVGTLGGGLNKLEKNGKKISIYENIPGNKNSLSDNSVSSIKIDKDSYLWVGTWGGGLNRSLNPVGNSESTDLKFIEYKNERSHPSYPGGNIIQAIYEDSDGQLWIGTETGIDLFDRKNDKFINFRNDPADLKSLSSNQVQSSIIEDEKGNLWIGTWSGLNKLSSELRKNALQNSASVKFTRYYFQPENKNSLSDERVISVCEDSNGNLWFGTYGGGLNKLLVNQSGEEKFINYSIKEGLSSNIIYSILEDDAGNIWVSTDNGISMFDVARNKFRNYDVSDGLQGNQFFWGAGFKGKNGVLYFGGTNGFNSFKPEELKSNDHIPPVVITNFQIFNKPVEINSEESPLKKSISLTREIELQHNQTVFSFEFAALDYTVPGKNQYAYMMEGFDEDWIYSGNRRFVTYTNLDAGNYTFKVKGSNNDGVWNETGTSLSISILPPLWKTWWFILLTIILIVLAIASIIYFRVKHLLDIERLRTKLAADLHDNIGSSLTEISILSEVISKKIKSEDDTVKNSLGKISTNSRNLIDNMSDIVWLVNPKRDSLYDLILRLRDTYSELSSYTSISFRSENIKALEKVSLSMEHRQHLYLIFKEAINNCITHSECSEITLDASVKGRTLLMTLKDNGKGFCPDEISGNGNGLGNMKNRAEIIGGNLKIFSDEGKGTSVQFEGNIL